MSFHKQTGLTRKGTPNPNRNINKRSELLRLSSPQESGGYYCAHQLPHQRGEVVLKEGNSGFALIGRNAGSTAARLN